MYAFTHKDNFDAIILGIPTLKFAVSYTHNENFLSGITNWKSFIYNFMRKKYLLYSKG